MCVCGHMNLLFEVKIFRPENDITFFACGSEHKCVDSTVGLKEVLPQLKNQGVSRLSM